MHSTRSSPCCILLFVLCAALCIVIPATAAEGKVTIAYRYSGGSYIGDTIIFDGLNTAGNMTVVKITGPNLPAEGVPLYDLNGIPGSGNTVAVDSRNLWVYSWDMSRIDTSKLRTARYTFTAWDEADPQVTASTSIVLKKPEFYMTVKPPVARIGDYIEVEGMAEKGVTYIRIDVSDQTGRIVRTFMAPVSGVGFFHDGFHGDLQAGRYTVTGSNPSLKQTLQLDLTITPPAATATTPAVPEEATGDATMTPADAGTSAGATNPVPTRAGVFSSSLALTLISVGSAALLLARR